MSKLLVKILVGLVTVISVLGLFSFTVVKLSNQVRFVHYWTDFVSPSLVYLSQGQNQVFTDTRFKKLLKPIKDESLSSVNISRLESGQTVLDVSDHEFFIWFMYSNDELIVYRSDFEGFEIYDLYLDIIIDRFSTDENITNQEVSQLADQLNVQISPLSANPIFKSKVDLINESGFHIFKFKDSMAAVIRATNNKIYELRFPAYYSSISWPILLFLLLVAIAVFALIAYQLIQNLERRLRNIETAASRISRGELDARVSNAGNDDSISRLGAAFNSMADHIQRLMLVQKEMIHAVSHELRTPVARIRFGVQMIEDCPSKEELEKQVRGIDGDIQELDELIDEILTYARLEQGGPILAFQEADVSAIVEQVVSEQGGVKPNMKIFSEYKKDSDVWKISEVEARYIHRSIQNLVGNATRYASSKVRVVCSFDSDTCRIDVEDDGPGIPEADWESVFTPFARLDDSRTRSSGGYGLGLSIVRRILYWHGGQAFLGKSDLGGAKFSLVWPRKQVKH